MFTWEMFQKFFYDKYFPRRIRRQNKCEFLHLQQRNKTIVEYKTKLA